MTPPLTQACYDGDLPLVERLLFEGADVHESDDWPIQAASKHGHLEIVQRLIVAGARVDTDRQFALRMAITHGHHKVAETLFEAGAHGDDEDYRGWLKRTCEKGRAAIAKLLISKGADVHVDDDAPLVFACYGGHAKVVEVLLRAGANVHARRNGPLHSAVEHRHVPVIRRLIGAGADPRSVSVPIMGVPDCVCGCSMFRTPRQRNRHLELTREIENLLREMADVVNSPYTAWWHPLLSLQFLPPCAKLPWVFVNIHLKPRFRNWLQRARNRLDCPPTEPLGKTRPTRAELIEHLKSAGRRFAREYWAEGAPIFFPDLALGPTPTEFAEKKLT